MRASSTFILPFTYGRESVHKVTLVDEALMESWGMWTFSILFMFCMFPLNLYRVRFGSVWSRFDLGR